MPGVCCSITQDAYQTNAYFKFNDKWVPRIQNSEDHKSHKEFLSFLVGIQISTFIDSYQEKRRQNKMRGGNISVNKFKANAISGIANLFMRYGTSKIRYEFGSTGSYL